MKKDFFTLLFIMGAVAALIIFGYTAGYQIGCTLGEDLTIMTTNK
jgi:hypothetical protein